MKNCSSRIELDKAVQKLLEIKDSDIRISILDQAFAAVDKGVHIGGCFSAVVPMVTMYYGGYMNIDVENPTKPGQDMFVLSKGHSVALMASIYADLGYFNKALLSGSRSVESILNGHPGPLLPGVHISTGPLGQGIAVAQGFALIGKESPNFDVYCMAGDGELQEGIFWEPVMYSAYKGLDNLCLVVDRNYGQLDNVERLVMDIGDVGLKFESFGWRVIDVDGTAYRAVMEAFDEFKYGERDGRPTVIICHTTKGNGGFSNVMNMHKITLEEAVYKTEKALQLERRERRVREFAGILNCLPEEEKAWLQEMGRNMNYTFEFRDGVLAGVVWTEPVCKVKKAPVRDKKVKYNPDELPRIDPQKKYAASKIIEDVMKVFAKDTKVVAIDSDLSSTSGLGPGIIPVDQSRALNAGIAEANMMNLAEAFAVMGYNVWNSTFCPFFDWKVMRRIAVGQQERMEVIAEKDGWLSEGHGLDITFLATAANLDTQVNGATHMGNDDLMVFDEIAQLKIIDVSCPQQLLGIMKWIAEGNKGLVYLRIMRAASGVIYGPDFTFEYGKGYVVRINPEDKVVVISSGRGVHEALGAAQLLENENVGVTVVDMPSVDEDMLMDIYNSGKLMIFAEQNNGYIYKKFREIAFRRAKTIEPGRIVAVNTTGINGEKHFIHSGTYQELADKYGLSSRKLKDFILKIVNTK